MRSIKIALLAVLVFTVSGSAFSLSADMENKLSSILNAETTEAGMTKFKEVLDTAENYDDYQACIGVLDSALKADPNSKNIDLVYYAMGAVRIKQIKYLSAQNDIKSTRLYMQVGTKYLDEALEYLDKAMDKTVSRKLLPDINLMKFIVYREKFLEPESEEMFNAIAGDIAKFSDDPKVNKKELDRMSEQFNKMGLYDKALQLKLLFASQTTKEGAVEVAEEIKAEADKLFSEGNEKQADTLYRYYIKLARRVYEARQRADSMFSIADKYFDDKKYREASNYYDEFLRTYPDSELADYAAYKIALCFFKEKRQKDAALKLASFLETYPASRWFNEGYKVLARIDYELPSNDTARAELKELSKMYPDKDIKAYSELLIALLYYAEGKYDNAGAILEDINKNFPSSKYAYAVNTVIDDIASIKDGNPPMLSADKEDSYKRWHPDTPINISFDAGDLIVTEGEFQGQTKSYYISILEGQDVVFNLGDISDVDEFGEYMQDRSDISRLPRKLQDVKEEDLLSISWDANDGSFADSLQTAKKTWTAPAKKGEYKVTATVEDLGLVKFPNEGVRKEAEPTVIDITVYVDNLETELMNSNKIEEEEKASFSNTKAAE